MKKILFLFALIAFCFNSNASHIAAAEIWYEHDTLNDYTIHLKVYRSCLGVNLGPTQTVSVTGGATFNLTLNQTSSNPLYSCIPNTCLNPTSNVDGYEVFTFSGTTTLSPASNWNFSWQTCCRTPNQTGPSSSTTVFATLDNLNVPFNNMSFVPYNVYTYYYMNQSQSINFGTVDLDGDSLDHRLTAAWNNGGPYSLVNYNTPLSPMNPVTTNPATPAAFVMNSSTGVLNFTPTNIGQYIIAIETREFRNGVQISSAIRDYQITTVASTNLFPSLSGINGTPTTQTNIAACPSANLNFTINSSDPDPLDSTKIIPLFVPAGATFVTNTAQNEIGTFNWSPTAADVQAQPYLLVLEVRDNNCGIRHKVFEIYVNNCNTDTVWAGDANADFTCDNYDVLNIGIANGTTGVVRPGATINWQAEWCLDWLNSFVSSINYKHADCNGDGTVNVTDIAAVTANYGLTHQKTNKIGQYKTLGFPDLYCDLANVQANKGSTVTVPIMLGAPGSEINNFYGISATVELLNAQTSAPISVNKSISWIGNATNSFDFEKNLAANKSAFTFVRNNQQNLMSQQGQIGEIVFPIDANSATGSKVIVQFSDIKMIQKNGEEITDYNVLSDTMEILSPSSVNDYTKQFEVSVFPNPNQGQFSLSLQVKQSSLFTIALFDASGRKVGNDLIQKTFSQGKHIVELKITDKAIGHYFLEIKTEEGKKMIPIQKW